MNKQDPWGYTDDDYCAALAAVRAEALKIIAEIRAGSSNPFEPLTRRLNREIRQRNADAQFDNARERDQQGLTAWEKL